MKEYIHNNDNIYTDELYHRERLLMHSETAKTQNSPPIHEV